MKYLFERIAVAIVGIGLSVIAAILGMYLVFSTELKFLQHLLYSVVFILQPVMTVVLIRYMFRKQGARPAKPAEPDEYEDDEDYGEDEEDEEDEGEAPAFHIPLPKKKPAAPAAHTAPAAHSAQAASEPAPQTAYDSEIPEASFDTGYASHETALEELERMEREAADFTSSSQEPPEDSSLAGAIGRKLGGFFEKKNGDET